MNETNPTLDRLETEIAWYSRKSQLDQHWFKHLKIIEIVCAAFIPFSANYNLSVYVTGGLGAAIVVLEGIQGLYQFQQNWTTYRSTAEALKHEKYLWLAKAGPYLHVENPDPPACRTRGIPYLTGECKVGNGPRVGRDDKTTG
jgi:hypothetical protein